MEIAALLTEKTLTLKEAAGIAKVSTNTIFRWHRTGLRGVVLETATIGRRRLSSREALERFAQATGEPAPKSNPVKQHRKQPKAGN